MQTPLRLLLQDKGRTVHDIAPQATVYDSVLKMKDLGIGALLIIENGILTGLLSERDIVQKIVGCQCDPSSVHVQDVMAKDIITVTSTTTVQEAMRLVTEHRVRHLPVVDAGTIVGLISIGDLTKWLMLQQQREIDALTGYIQGNKST